MGAFLKMWWMFWWRFSFIILFFEPVALGLDFLASGTLAGIIAFGARKTILIFPLIRLIFAEPAIADRFTTWTWPATKTERARKNRDAELSRMRKNMDATRKQTKPYQRIFNRRKRPHRSWTRPDQYRSKRTRSDRQRSEQYRRNTTPPDGGPQIQRASRKGRMTGYEPKALHDVREVISVNAHGVAGLGLFDAGFNSNNVYTGQAGEINFYKALCKDELIDNFSSFWSVSLPAEDYPVRPATDYTTDVDCIVVNGNWMYLLDLKNYASGDVTWYTNDGEYLLCRDSATGSQVNRPRKMSRNMSMALERFRELFPQHYVEAFVVMMPTNQGAGKVRSDTFFPGYIEVVELTDILIELRAQPPASADDDTVEALNALRE